MTEDAMLVAREALDLAKDVDRRVMSHEDICAIRYKALEIGLESLRTEVTGSVNDIKKVLGWAGGLLVVTMIGVLGFFLKAQFDLTSEMQRQMISLQQQPSGYEQPK